MFSSKRVKTTIFTAALVLTAAGALVGRANAASADCEHDKKTNLVIENEVVLSEERNTTSTYNFVFDRDEMRAYMMSGELPAIEQQSVYDAFDPCRLDLGDGVRIENANNNKHGGCAHGDTACEVAKLTPAKNNESNNSNNSAVAPSKYVRPHLNEGGRRYTRKSIIMNSYRMENFEYLETANCEYYKINSAIKTEKDRTLTLRNRYESGGYFRTVSLAAGSYSRGSISISTTVAAHKTADRLGVRSISLQRYENNRWMTVKTWTNSYREDTSRFSFNTTASDLSSGSLYRVVATYTLRIRSVTATITRISSPLICR